MGQQGCCEAYLPPEIFKNMYVKKRKCQEKNCEDDHRGPAEWCWDKAKRRKICHWEVSSPFKSRIYSKELGRGRSLCLRKRAI